MRSKECAKNIFQSKEVRKRLFPVANLIYKTKTGEKNFPPASPNQLNYLSDTAYNDAACTPSTPAIAPATAIITFKTTLQVFFIDFFLLSFLSFSDYTVGSGASSSPPPSFPPPPFSPSSGSFGVTEAFNFFRYSSRLIKSSFSSAQVAVFVIRSSLFA